MANHPSALKRQRQSEKRRDRHRATKSQLRTIRKKLEGLQKKDEAQSLLKQVVSAYAKAVRKGTLHANTASRRISSVTRFVNGLK